MNFRHEDVSQRLRLRLRHEGLRRKVKVSHDVFSLKGLVEFHSAWMDESATCHGIRDVMADSGAQSPGTLNIGSQNLWTGFNEKYPSHSERIKRRGELLLEGVATIFGWMKVDIGSAPNWRSCFDEKDSTKEWSDDFYWTIDFSRLKSGPAPDVKINWEINRLQFLLDLGMCFRISGANSYALKARSFLESWLDSVVYPFGPQWASNLEVGLRVLSIVRLCQFFADSEVWDDEFLLKVMASVELHLDHLENELTLHHTRGNHLLGEAASLLQVSLLLSFLKKSKSRIQRASRILDSVIPDLILSDGVYAEQSVSYAKFVLEFLLPLCSSESMINKPLSDSSMTLILKCLKFLAEISNNDGMIPMVGDSDSGSALGLCLDDYWDFTPLFASGAFMFKDPALLKRVGGFPPESFIVCGKDGLKWHESFVNATAARNDGLSMERPMVTHFPEGGLIKAEYKSFKLLFDVGPLGKSPGFEHGHSDGLSAQLWLDDQSALIDPGTFVYNANPRWRKYFKGSSAHNVLQFRGADQSRSLGSFRWAYSPEISDVSAIASQRHFCLSGTLRLKDALWTRSILNVGTGAVVILDELRGTKDGVLNMNLVFDPSIRIVERSEDSIEEEGFIAGLMLLGWPERSIDLLYADEDAPGGWFSRLYGQREATFQLRTQAEVTQANRSAIIIAKNFRDMMDISALDKSGLEVKGNIEDKTISWFRRTLAEGDSNGLVKRYRMFKTPAKAKRTE